MANSKILAKITMLSAGSAAPYDSAVVGLTTWDQDLVVGGVTYLKGRIIALSKAAASSGDASRGQGGYASSLELSLTIADRCAAGRLWPLVEAGAVPLVGAEVRIINESGDMAPQTWYLHEPKLDGASIKFTLKTMRYLCTKPVSWSAMRYDEAITVGLSVGDAAVQGANAAGRYKGVSVPTDSVDSFQKVTSIDTTPWNFGNPLAAVSRVPNAAFTAFRVVETDFSNLAGSALWPTSRKAFEFRFLSQQGLTDFVSKNLGVRYNTTTKIFTKNTVSPNTIFSITDGSNFEVISRSDSNGSIISTQSAGWVPLQGDTVDCIASDSLSGCFEEGSPSYLWGTRDNTAPFNGGTTGKFYYESGFLLFVVCEKPQTVDNVTFYALYISPCVDGSLYNSSASQVWLAESTPENPICAGAVGLVGFNSTGSSSKEAGVVIANGITKISNNIISFLPTSIFDGKFAAWTDLPVLGHIAMYASAVSDDGVAAMSFDGNISDIDNVVPGSNAWYMRGLFSFAANCGAGFPSYHWTWKFDIPKKLPNFSIDKVFTDWEMRFLVSNGSASTFDIKAMAPFFASTFTVPSVKPAYTTYWTVPFFGKGVYSKSRTFDSLDALNGAAVGSKGGLETAIHVANASVARSFEQRFRALHIYAITNLAFGSNPAVVVPGNFPGTSNPTTTPAMAIDQLAAWAGLSVIKTGGWTPPSGVWGRYLGPDPSSDNSADPLTVTQAIDKLSSEAWMWVAEGSAPAAAPTIESMTPPVLDTSSIDDVVTLPRISYCYAGTSAQFTAEIFKADESFDIAKGDGYFWGGWQEKDACHFSTSPGSAVLAMCQLEDCLAVVCADGYLRCSYDGGVTWPFSLNLGDTSDGMVMAGNGIMLAFSYLSGNVVVARSIDAGRTWSTSSPAALAGATIPGSWYDADSQRFWICGSLSGGGASLWYSSDGITWTHISAELSIGSRANRIAASGNLLVVSAAPDTWGIWISTNLGATWTRTPALPQTGIAEPFLGRWNGAFRVAVGTALYSSADLSTWTSVTTPAPLQAFATDGAVVSALAAEPAGGNHTYYSRDQGATWRAVRISPEGFTWVSIGALTAIWDDNAKCFRFSGWGSTRLIALGDPSVLDIWLRCRASYLKTQTLHAETYDWSGIYDADVVVSMLLDAKDGIDAEYQQSRIDWMTKQARFATLKVEFADIVEQLSLTAFQRIAIPRQRLEDSLLAGNIPTQGILTKVDPDPMTGVSTIEIIMPPL